MPWSYEIHADRRLVHVRASGHLGAEDLVLLWGEVRSDAAFSPDFDCLVDFSKVASTDLDGSDMRALATTRPLFADGARRAVVVRSDLGYGLVRMYQLMADRESENVKLFWSLEDAMEWLPR